MTLSLKGVRFTSAANSSLSGRCPFKAEFNDTTLSLTALDAMSLYIFLVRPNAVSIL